MIESKAIALGTTPCWSGCLYEINPDIAGIDSLNDDVFEEQDNDNT